MGKKLGPKALKRALDNLSEAQTKVNHWRGIISDHCLAKYGYDPADVNNDEFLDACDGLCGAGSSMTAEEFHRSMIDSIKIFERRD